ncbi:MAG: hypothetical protein MMC33_009519 [Icmadophila ericetorum]|nr:hypothetical protein [Icmadophila ericetorum]
MAQTTSGGNSLQLAEALLAQFPDCAKAPILAGIASNSCGLDVACLCTNNNFLLLLQGIVLADCTLDDGEKILTLSDTLCTSAVPSFADSRQPMIIAVLVVLVVLALAAVTARLTSRRITSAQLWWDDYLIIGALIFSLGLNADDFYGLHIGLGKHAVTTSIWDLIAFGKVRLRMLIDSNAVCLTAIIRLPLLFKLNEADPTWTIVDAGIWLNVEGSLGIVCACLPTMRPVFRLAGSSIRSRVVKYSGGTRISSREADQRATSLEEIIPTKQQYSFNDRSKSPV